MRVIRTFGEGGSKVETSAPDLGREADMGHRDGRSQTVIPHFAGRSGPNHQMIGRADMLYTYGSAPWQENQPFSA
jgi:hypothetical protein